MSLGSLDTVSAWHHVLLLCDVRRLCLLFHILQIIVFRTYPSILQYNRINDNGSNETIDPGSVPDLDPAPFVSDLADGNKKKLSRFFAFYFIKVHLHDSSRIKNHKVRKREKPEIMGFLTNFA
jgi:hypothetical protein